MEASWMGNTLAPQTQHAQPLSDDPHKKLKGHLAKFLLSLIQAFLRTGYYTAGHPEARKAKLGLYEEFQGLFTQKGELTFMVREDPGGRAILIEGVLPEIENLNSVMLRGMAEMYTPKFATFLERKDLISLTLKDTMARTEFTNFVDLMGEPIFVDTREKSDKERFSRTLTERGIFNISYIFTEEFLSIRRKVPWRSQIALTRLKKDFSMVPLYLGVDAQGMKKVRREVIHDVVRPIQNIETIYPILVNADLAQTKELREFDIAEEIIACLSDELLLTLSKILLQDSLRRGDTQPHDRSLRLARQVASALNLRCIKGRESILTEYFRHKLIPLEQLPEKVQHTIKSEQLIDKFIRHSSSFLDQFDRIEDRTQYFRIGLSLTEIIPELIRRDRYEEILEIIAHIDRHVHEKEHLSIYAGKVLEEMEKGEILQALKRRFLSGQKEIREAIAPIFIRFGVEALPQLLSLLIQSNDHVVRRHTCEILVQIDPSAINIILDELTKGGIEIKSTIDIIRVLGEIDCDEWIQPLAKALRAYLTHENAHLREEALRVYYKIMGGEGENVYLGLLNDTDIGVQKTAIQCLASIKSEVALEKFLQILKNAEDSPSHRNPSIEASLFGALAFYGNVERPEIGLVEDFLLQILSRHLSLGPFRFLTRKKDSLSEGAIAAICKTLGEIGTDKSLSILQRMDRETNRSWHAEAKEGLMKIAARQGDRSSINAS
jgi:HEAT repeat protein